MADRLAVVESMLKESHGERGHISPNNGFIELDLRPSPSTPLKTTGFPPNPPFNLIFDEDELHNASKKTVKENGQSVLATQEPYQGITSPVDNDVDIEYAGTVFASMVVP